MRDDYTSGLPEEELFRPFQMGPLKTRSRVVMAPMTRGWASDGVVSERSADYYARRAQAGVGLIITEGTWIDHPAASTSNTSPRFYGQDALAGWKKVVEQVHANGGRIFPQLWHAGAARNAPRGAFHPDVVAIAPSSAAFSEYGEEQYEVPGRPMTDGDIDAVIEAFGRAARSALDLGFDGIEIHGAHGYLIDQFIWSNTNSRTDRYGGSIEGRVRFAAAIVRECRRVTTPDFPIGLRLSQWKSWDYQASIAKTPQEFARILEPLAEAGVDIIHCSQRRYWEPAFEGSDLNLAGWAKKLTGKVVITVGSVGLNEPHQTRFNEPKNPYETSVVKIERLLDMFARGEFDLVAVGRALLADSRWSEKVRESKWDSINPYASKMKQTYF